MSCPRRAESAAACGRSGSLLRSARVRSYRVPAIRCRAGEARPPYAHKLQELIGGAYGEMTVTMQYLFQGWNCRMPGKYKDLIMDVATEEMGHVEMIATMVARLLEGAPATATTKAALADPVGGAVLSGMDRSKPSWRAAVPCSPTVTVTRGTAGTSWPAGTFWLTSVPTPPPKRKGGCRLPGSTT